MAPALPHRAEDRRRAAMRGLVLDRDVRDGRVPPRPVRGRVRRPRTGRRLRPLAGQAPNRDEEPAR